MIDCWQEDLGARPTFEALRERMKSFEENHQVCVKVLFLYYIPKLTAVMVLKTITIMIMITMLRSNKILKFRSVKLY